MPARASPSASFLACSNIVIGLLPQFTSVVATGFEFAGDVLASSIVLIGMRVAAAPADEHHPYGHGRFETLSAFFVGVVLVAGGVMIGLATYDPVRFLAADHYGGFVVGIVVVITGGRIVRDASFELVDTMSPAELTGEI